MNCRLSLLALEFVLGCKHPSPLGTFTRDDLPAWKGDCGVQIVEEDPHAASAPGPVPNDGGEPSFGRATRRYRCPSPGWSIYTDTDSRVVGVCVDELWVPRTYTSARELEDAAAGKIPRNITVSEVDRARPLITAHWGRERADAMLRGTVGGRCADRGERVEGGMTRWE
jgi:hypothetical protein